MATYKRKLKPEFEPKKKELDEMNNKELKTICEEYGIPTNGSKDEVIKRIAAYESGKLLKPVVYTHSENKKLNFIGIFIKDHENLLKVSKLVAEKTIWFHHYASDYIFFFNPNKLKL
jgi:hypothetical protein